MNAASGPIPIARLDGPEWWRGGVGYEVYVRSFLDSNGDGVGDLAGITSQLSYLAELGVDVVWSRRSTPALARITATTSPTTPTSIPSSAHSPTSTN